jgi:hypothetical protein
MRRRRAYRRDMAHVGEVGSEIVPEWRGFGGQAGKHPPMRGRLATPVCSEDASTSGLLQLSDKAAGADFTEEVADSIRDLAAFAGAALDALRAAYARSGAPAG